MYFKGEKVKGTVGGEWGGRKVKMEQIKYHEQDMWWRLLLENVHCHIFREICRNWTVPPMV